ncbi:Tn3 family transposase [Actinoallomurus vinaceus]|uniref:Tn3 family transposase n=1 Tax=Actinoallomurus vinaceus TaxID=1080074 RepID=UPI0031E8BE31
MDEEAELRSSEVAPPGWLALGASLTRPIKWDLIAQQHDRMVKFATALRLGTAEAEPQGAPAAL